MPAKLTRQKLSQFLLKAGSGVMPLPEPIVLMVYFRL
jgi:hypothetical protein